MLRKITLRTLLILFCILLVLVIFTQILQRHKGDRTFRSELADFDTAKVESVSLTDPSKKSGLDLLKTGNQWKIRAGGKEYRADRKTVLSFLTQLRALKADRLAAESGTEWKKYEVTDSLALHVLVKGKSRILADLLIGKFTLQPPDNPYERQGKMTSYIRLAGGKEVYAVDGFFRLSLSPNVNNFRDRTLLSSNPESLEKITFQYPADSSFILEKQGSSWTIGGQQTDSAKTSTYLSSFNHLMGYEFNDTTPVSDNPEYTLTLEFKSSPPLKLMAFDTHTDQNRIITSSVFPDTRFNGRNGLFDEIFKNKEYFMSQKPPTLAK